LSQLGFEDGGDVITWIHALTGGRINGVGNGNIRDSFQRRIRPETAYDTLLLGIGALQER